MAASNNSASTKSERSILPANNSRRTSILFVRLRSTTTLLSGVTRPELSLCKADFLLPLLNLLCGFNDVQAEPLRKFSQRHQLIKRGFPCEMPEPAELFPGVDDF